MGREVIVYEGVNFAGKSQALAAGRYTLEQLGIGDDTLSSLKVPPGMEVILYEDTDFGGRKVSFAGDTSNVGNFDDKTSSIEIRELPTSRSPAGVTLYTGAEFAGASVMLGVGHHNLAAMTVGDDAIASVKVPRGWRVTLFADAGARGASLTFTVDSGDVGHLRGKISSATVERGGAWAILDPHPNFGVTAFTEPDFAGESQVLAIGRYEASQLGSAIESLSSLRVPMGLQVTLYEHSGFRGRSLRFGADTSNIGDFNDRVSSLVVAAAQPGTEPQMLARIEQPIKHVFFDLFTREYKLPVNFLKKPKATILAETIKYVGAAKIDPPFNIKVKSLELTVSKTQPIEYVFRFEMPDAVADMIKSEITKLPNETRGIVNSFVMPFVDVIDDAVIIIANKSGTDPQLGEDYVYGITLFSKIMADSIQPLTALQKTFPDLGLDTKEVTLSVASLRGAQLGYRVRARVPINQPLGSDALVFRDVGVELNSTQKSLAAGLFAIFDLNIDQQPLTLKGGIEGEIGQNGMLRLKAVLQSNNGVWKDPLGFRGIALTAFGVSLGWSPKFPHWEIGAFGGFMIGDGLLDGTVALLVNTTAPQASIVHLSSPSGINIYSLVAALTGTNPTSIFNVGISNLLVTLAPQGGTINNVYYDPGLTVGGKLSLWGWGATLGGKLKFGEAGSLSCKLDPLVLGAQGAEFLAVKNAGIDFAFSNQGVSNSFSGEFTLAGKYAFSLATLMDPFGSFGVKTDLQMDIFSGAAISFKDGQFGVRFMPTIGVDVEVGGMKIPLKVGCNVFVSLSKQSFEAHLSFEYTVWDRTLSLGLTVGVPILSAADLQAWFLSIFSSEGRPWFLKALFELRDKAVRWLKSLGKTLVEVGEFFKGVGADLGNLAKDLSSAFSVSPEAAVKALNVPVEKAAEILHKVFKKPAEEVGKILHEVFKVPGAQLGAVLHGAGYAADTVNNALANLGGSIPNIPNPFENVPNPFEDIPNPFGLHGIGKG